MVRGLSSQAAMNIKTKEGNEHASSRIPWWQTSRGLDIFWAAALAAVLFFLLHDSLVGGKGLVPADGVLKYAPWSDPGRIGNHLLRDQYDVFIPEHEFVRQQLEQGNFPLWDPQVDCGVPVLASMQGALLFPMQLLFARVEPFYASGPAAFLKLFLAGWFMMLFVRLLGASRPAAFISAIAFCLCGFMIVWLGHPHVNCAMWLPLLLYFVEKSFRVETEGRVSAAVVRSWIGFAVTYGIMMLGGHPPTQVHVTIAVALYFLFRMVTCRREQRWPQVGLVVLALVAGALLAAPQILPFLEYTRESSSGLASAVVNRGASHLSPSTLIHFLLPHISGNPAAGFEDHASLFGLEKEDNFNERTGYIGILPLFLAVCTVARWRCQFTRFFLGLAVGCALVVYGVPPFSYVLKLLPVLHDINHTRLLLLVSFSLAVLAGLGWDAVVQLDSRRRMFWVAGGFLVVGLAVLIWAWLKMEPQFSTFEAAYRSFLLQNVFVLLGGLVFIVALVVWPKRWFAWAAFLVWAAIDLLWFGTGYNPAISRDRYYPSTPAIQWLRQDPSAFRIMGIGHVLPPNTANVFGLYDVRGYDFTTVRRYEELISGSGGNFLFFNSAPTFPLSFPLLNAKYVLSEKPLPLNPQVFEPVYANEISIYRYKACVDRASVVFDYQVEKDPKAVLDRVRSLNFDPTKVLLLETEPELAREGQSVGVTNAAVQITGYRADEVQLTASLPKPGFLLLLDTYFPGWKATVNGRETSIYRADYNFRAVALPAGNSTVRFVYEPMSVRVGGVLAGVMLMGLVVVWFWSGRRVVSGGNC